MRKLILYGVCFLQAFTLTAQTPAAKFREINDTVAARYNRGDYKSIYAAASDIYKSLNSEGELTGNLESLKKDFGQVISSEQIEDFGNIKFFKWTCQKGAIKLELWLDGSSIIQYKFNNFIRQPNTVTNKVLSDNPLKTQLDSVVDKYARIYMSDPKAVGLSWVFTRTEKSLPIATAKWKREQASR